MTPREHRRMRPAEWVSMTLFGLLCVLIAAAGLGILSLPVWIWFV